MIARCVAALFVFQASRLADRAPLSSFARRFTNMYHYMYRQHAQVVMLWAYGRPLRSALYMSVLSNFEHNTFSSLCVPVSGSVSPFGTHHILFWDCFGNYRFAINCLITCATITFATFILHLHEDNLQPWFR